MNGDLAIRGMLGANAAISAHVGVNIFYDEADQGTQLPFIIVNLDSVEASDTDTGVSTLDFDHVYVMCFAETKSECAEIATDIRTALDRQVGKYNDVVVESVQFQTQRGYSEFLVDKKVHVYEQLFQVMNQVQHYFDYYLDFQFE